MNPSSYTSTLLKAFDILDCFSSDSQEIGIKDISQKIDMPQSSVYRIIQSLEFAGMIYQNRENRKYRLGPKFIALSGRQSSLSGYMDIAMKYMKLLGHERLRCVAAPICGPGGKALFSISVSAPSLRMDDARYELVRQLVVRYSALATAEIQEL